MKLRQIADVVGGLPWMTEYEAAEITAIIASEKPRHILELAFKHGVSTCYMAGALQEAGEGHITSIDLISVRNLEPNADQLIQRLGLREFVTLYYLELCEESFAAGRGLGQGNAARPVRNAAGAQGLRPAGKRTPCVMRKLRRLG